MDHRRLGTGHVDDAAGVGSLLWRTHQTKEYPEHPLA
jgi:hypothetical protein